MRQLGLGILGLGEGRSAISAALASDDWNLRLICDLNEALCQERCAEFDFAPYTLDYGEMLADDQIDVIAIYTPDQLHGQHIRQALEAGKHVICTKPLIPSLDEARELFDTWQQADRHVFVGQSTRFFEPMIHQREDFETGRYGTVHTVEATYHTDGRWFLERGWSTRPGFSWLFGFLSHAADLIRWYMPDVDEVMGYGWVAGQEAESSSATPNTMHFILRSESGGIARCSGNFVSPTLPHARHSQISCILRGDQGSGCAEYSNLIYTARFEHDEIHDYSHRHDYYFRFEGESHHAGEYQNYLEYFARCLRQGIVPQPGLIEGLGTIALLQAMARSIQWDTPVKISDVIADYGLTDIL